MGNRWEWRIFGENLGAAEGLLGGEAARAENRSEETYVLSPSEECNTKIRGGRVEVKHRLRRRPDGLELWEPRLEETFPLSRSALRRLFDSWGAPAPPLPESCDSAGALLTEIVVRVPSLLAVPVAKKRSARVFHGCTAEVVDLSVAGRAMRSLALESEDAGELASAVRALGRRGEENTSYPAALRALVRFRSEPAWRGR